MFDEKCLELARHFLQDVPPGHIREQSEDLAEAIQTAVENWFELRDHAVVVAAEGDESREGGSVERG